MSEPERIVVIPDVARVSEGLRDTGYEFNTAVADIVDNSIAAGATQIDVRVAADFSGAMQVSIGDNGCGMDRADLINAMRYGSERRPDPSSLGKFGLGLKTAPTAFCRRVVVVSKKELSARPLRATWDLDVMSASNEWLLEVGEPGREELQLLEEASAGSPGTLVLWEKVDRLLPDYSRPDGRPMRNALRRVESQLRDHLAMVYQRFLDPDDARARTVSIAVNGTAVAFWDPFRTTDSGEPVVEHTQPIDLPNGARTSFLVRAFVLPRREEFASEEERTRARISNERQGVYVYRENRLIHGPDWLGMYKQEPHFSLLRVELSFDHNLDDAFQVDIKKSRILLDETLYDWLRDQFLAAPRREAEQRYRKGAAATAKGAAALLHSASSNAIQQKVGALRTATVTSVDERSGNVGFDNNTGHTSARLRIVTSEERGIVHVLTNDTLDNGVLWEATLANGAAAVTLNTAHPFYTKAYLPNRANSVAVQTMDFLLWSLAQAELNNVDSGNREAFEEFRIEVSRNLKKLVADLPDPPETGTD